MATGQRDAIELQSGTGVFDFRDATFVGIETILVTGTGNNSLAVSNSQFVNLAAIQLGSGADTLTVTMVAGQTMDLSAKTPSLGLVETWNNTGSGNVMATGAQFNLINYLVMSNSNLTLTSTSTRLAGMVDGELVGVASVTLAATTAGQTLDVGTQTEGLRLNGSTFADTVRGGSGNDSIASLSGADNIAGGAGNDVIALSTAASMAGVIIDGGTNGLSGDRDTLLIAGAGTIDLTTATLTGIESIRNGISGDTV